MHRVEFLPSAARQLAKLDRAVQHQIAARVDALAEDPRRAGSVKLRGADDVWRSRVGDYRILYQLFDDRLLVLVIRIGHRRDVYR